MAYTTLDWAASSYLGTRISSYLEHRKQFKRDLLYVMVSIQLFPREWDASIFDGKVYDLYKTDGSMRVWLANSIYGMEFTKDGVTWSEHVPFPAFFEGLIYPVSYWCWRARLRRVSMAWVKRYRHKDVNDFT